MDDHPDIRASDADRQEVVERLRVALDDGRLKMEEYLERMGLAYGAVTYGDLAPLCSDLPQATALARPQAVPPAPVPLPAPGRSGALAGLPVPLKIFWTIWLAAVSVNVVVWVLVSGTTGHLIYPWPLWVAGPSGAVLFAVSAGAAQIRRSHRPAPPRLPPGEG